MSRSEFSSHFGFNLRTIEKWEQGVRQPDGSARAYLTVISKNPKPVEHTKTTSASNQRSLGSAYYA